MSRYIHPLTDFGFKKLFGSENTKELLTDFLNQLLPPHHQIKQLTFIKNEQLGQRAVDRKAIFDLYCESETGDRFIVEVQKAYQEFFKDRSIYYSTFAIQEQAPQGEWDFSLSAIYTIGILDFAFKEAEEGYLHEVKLRTADGKAFCDKLTYIYIELVKFNKTLEELESAFEKWLYVLRHLANLQERPVALQERIYDKLFRAAEIAQFAPQERQAYEDSLKVYRDFKNVMDTAEKKGFEEGIQIGKEEGIQLGKEEGMSLGKEQALIEVARKLKQQDLSEAQIEAITGLDSEYMAKLEK